MSLITKTGEESESVFFIVVETRMFSEMTQEQSETTKRTCIVL